MMRVSKVHLISVFAAATTAILGQAVRSRGDLASTQASAPSTERATATSTQAAPSLIEIVTKGQKTKLQVMQEGKPIVPRGDNFHLKPAPFSVRVRGNLQLGIVASKSETLSKTLAKAREAFVYVVATNYAYEEGKLYLNEKANVVPWRTFSETWTGYDDKQLRDNLGGELPVVLNCGSQWLCAFAPENSDEYTFEIKQLMEVDRTLSDSGKDAKPLKEISWEKVPEVYLVLFSTIPMVEKEFDFANWKSIHLVSDEK